METGLGCKICLLCRHLRTALMKPKSQNSALGFVWHPAVQKIVVLEVSRVVRFRKTRYARITLLLRSSSLPAKKRSVPILSPKKSDGQPTAAKILFGACYCCKEFETVLPKFHQSGVLGGGSLV